MRRRIGKYARWLASTAVICGFVAGLSAGPASAAAAPAWQIYQNSLPTNFVPGTERVFGQGPMYEIFVQNVGGAPAAGTVFKDTLPAGITPATETEADFRYYDLSE